MRPPRGAMYRMAAFPPLYSRPNSLRRAVRRGAAWTVERHRVAAWSLPWLRSRWQSCHRRANLGCQAAHAGPTGGARRVPGGPPCGGGDRGCPNAFRAVRPFPVRVASGRHGVPGGVDGVRPDRPDMRCPEGCPIVVSMVDAGYDRADIGPDQACGGSGIEHGCRWSRQTGPGAGSGWGWPKGACALPCCPVRARTCRPRGGRGRLARRIVGRWALEVSAAWPPPSGPGPYPSARRSP
jgi:hypothetical protein